MPDTFNQESFESFGNMRSFPNQQIRKLICYLKDGKLLLEEKPVLVLVRLCLYNVGEIDDDGNLIWKTDLFLNLDSILQALENCGQNLKPRLRDHGSILILGEIALYFSQFHKNSAILPKFFADIAFEWAKHENENSKIVS